MKGVADSGVYVENGMKTNASLKAFDAYIVKAEAVYECRQEQPVLFALCRTQELEHLEVPLVHEIICTRDELHRVKGLIEDYRKRARDMNDDVLFGWATTKIEGVCRVAKRRCLASADDRELLGKHLGTVRATMSNCASA